MALKDQIALIVASYGDESLFDISSDSDGLLLTVTKQLLNHCEDGGATSNLLNQYIQLQMLQEEGIAERIANGFLINTEDAVCLDESIRHLLQIPAPWPGRFEVEFRGVTTRADYSIQLVPIDDAERSVQHFTVKGPLLRLTEKEVYLLDELQWAAIEAVQSHQQLTASDRGEYANLMAVSKLQQAHQLGLRIDLRHFEDISAIEPESVSVSVEVDDEGNGILTPAFKDVSPEEVEKRLVQFGESGRQSLRVGNKIILLDEKRIEAVQEILTKRKIPKDQMSTFLKTPSAYLSASLVDLDLGFSLRVQGVKEFTHAYFGETDESGIDWFAAHLAAGTILPPSKLHQVIKSEDDLVEFSDLVGATRATGATQCVFRERVFDISDQNAVAAALEDIRERLGRIDSPVGPEDDEPEVDEPKIRVAIDIARNDAENDFGDEGAIEDVLYEGAIDWSRYRRTPFNYQERGIRWMLGLSSHTIDLSRDDYGKFGCLLADDMGLGKTFMSLAAIGEYQREVEDAAIVSRPVLVVAPLTLLENWKEEVEKSFEQSPFDSVVILQSDADLKQFRVEGAGSETSQSLDASIENIRYGLKVGGNYGVDRLDMPRRLVLTTYQALRDYQFSLAMVEWAFVVFDEAQNIKNPNAMQTLAAKALKSHFKILATGTPVENSLKDFWCLMDTAKPGHLGAYQQFRQSYITPIARAADEEKAAVRLGVGKKLRNDVGPLMLRRVKEDQLDGLPMKNIYTGGIGGEKEQFLGVLRCEMTQRQRESYETIIEVVSDQQAAGEGGNPVLAGLQRLRDVSLHPGLVDGGAIPPPMNRGEALSLFAESGKLQAMLTLLEQIQARGEKVIIFLINKNLQAFLKVALEKIFDRKIAIINGDTKAIAKRAGVETRRSLITDFEAKPGFGLIVMSPIAAGTGLTIVGANNVIHLERHWNPAKEAQATDRVYRIGQTKDVNVYLPVLHHPDPEVQSFDLNLDRLLNSKMALKDAVITPEQLDPAELGKGLFGGKDNELKPRIYSPEDLSQMSWETFEAFAAELLGKFYEGDPVLTQKGGDKGADVIIRGTRNVIVQVKHTRTGKLGSESPLREVNWAKQQYEQAMEIEFDEAVVVTNARKIAPHLKSQMQAFNATLINFSKLKELMKKHQVSERDVLRRTGLPRYKIG